VQNLMRIGRALAVLRSLPNHQIWTHFNLIQTLLTDLSLEDTGRLKLMRRDALFFPHL